MNEQAACCWCRSPLVQAEGAYWCVQRACQARQAAWAIEATGKHGRTLLYVPTPRQVDFYETTRRVRRVLYGGQAGPGKSYALRWGLYRDCLSIKNLNCLLLRRTFKQLETTHLLDMAREARLLGADYLVGAKALKFQNGSVIQAGHCETRDDALNFLSTDYDRVVFDELVTFDRDPSLEIMSRARTSKPEVMKAGDAQVWAGTNPGGRGARWVRDFFIDHNVDRREFPKYRPERYGFVEATLADNPYISPQYREDLEDLPEMRKRQLLYGDWDAFEGQFFTDLHAGTHARSLQIDPGVEWSCGMDWGHNAPGWIGFFASLVDGHYHLHAEYRFQGMTADAVATAWHKLRESLGIARVRYIASDPAMWTRSGHGRGESIAETLQRRGLPMRKGDNDRFNGALRMHEMLRDDGSGVPYLTVDPGCRYWWRTLPALTSSPTDADDVDTTQDDHAYDGTRYWAMSRPSPTRVVVDTAAVVGSLRWHREQHEARNQTGVLA